MCTAASYKNGGFYFGRTLDYEISYGDSIVISPRKQPVLFRHTDAQETHYAIIGMAHLADSRPLYYDAMNEKGLCMAGLNFVGNAVYFEPREDKINIAQFEFIPYLLGKCANLDEARQALSEINLVNTCFSEALPPAQLHWMIGDKSGCITVESVADGLQVYENPVGVLTNNPPFPLQLFNLNNYRRLSSRDPENTFCESLPLMTYSRGMGGMGLPGDLSSQSRFVRVAFVKSKSLSDGTEMGNVSQFFHILGSVDQQRGCCEVRAGEYEITLYTGCMSADTGVYYYTTYDNHRICAVDMHKADLDGNTAVCFKPIAEESVYYHEFN